MGQDPLSILTYVCLLIWGGVLSYFDFREHRLPDRLTLTAYPILLVGLAVFRPLELGTTSGLAIFGIFCGLFANRFLDVGLGDAKLLGACALFMGFNKNPIEAALTAAVCASLIGGIHALIQLVFTRDPKSYLPFGPAILFGSLYGLISA